MIAFRAVDSILRHDPVLSSITEQMLSWRGEVEDVLDPTASTCPWLRISPSADVSWWETEGQHRMPMSITLEAAVMGSDITQMLNYWAAIRRALWPQGDATARDAIRTAMQAARISRPILTQPSYTVMKLTDSDSGARITLAQGQLRLILLIDTP